MTKREKRLQKLRQNPKNVAFEELRQVLEDEGFTLDHATGSHHIFRRVIGERVFRVVIPYARPVKSPYVRQVLAAVDEARVLRGADVNEEEDDD